MTGDGIGAGGDLLVYRRAGLNIRRSRRGPMSEMKFARARRRWAWLLLWVALLALAWAASEWWLLANGRGVFEQFVPPGAEVLPVPDSVLDATRIRMYVALAAAVAAAIGSALLFRRPSQPVAEPVTQL